MAQTNEYPDFKTIEEIPYLQNLELRLIYAKNFTPHKVAYYEQSIKDFKDKISDQSMRDLLTNNGYKITIGIHGQIFIHPINKGECFVKEFRNVREAYNYYLNK